MICILAFGLAYWFILYLLFSVSNKKAVTTNLGSHCSLYNIDFSQQKRQSFKCPVKYLKLFIVIRKVENADWSLMEYTQFPPAFGPFGV